MKNLKTRSNYWQLAPYIQWQWRTILQAFICTLVFTAFWPMLAWLTGRMLSLLVRGEVVALARVAAITVGGFLVHKLAQYGQDSLMAKAALNVAFNLRKRAYAHLQSLSLAYFEQTKTGDLAYRLTEDIDRIGEVTNRVFHDLVPCVLQLVVVLGYMLYLNWQLTLVALVLVPALALLGGWFGNRMLRFS
ncbi:MAG: ABC transporter ATP-binding protein, partial [Cyanobacteria bacterium P01_D01_bin.128]